tara:strand:- start:101 stop:370 length:270 start_codon:yes stop_codon:yes gene_type:complete
MKILKSYFLQFILSVVAAISWIEASEIGNRVSSEVEDATVLKNIDSNEFIVGGAAVDITSGFLGGSLAMGLITSVCIVMIVLIEIKKTK